MASDSVPHLPATFVIFGITGDLSRTKLIPSLFDLHAKGKLPPKFHVVGFARRNFSPDQYRAFIGEMLKGKGRSESDIASFLERQSYVQGTFEEKESYGTLLEELNVLDREAHRECSNKLFYLAVPPVHYETIVLNLSHSGLTVPCGGPLGWTRVLIEKPFGKNLEAARRLDLLLGTLFKEEQIFRIDHYLAKESLQNILTFRFSNTMFDPIWNRSFIERVEINLFEEDAVDARAAFYNETGALRDVGQNHLLQMLALIAMERPRTRFPEDIRKARAEALESLAKFRSSSLSQIVRAQYKGYAPAGNSDRETETFFSIPAFIENERWKGVPFILSSGKALGESRVEIRVRFKDLTEGSFLPMQVPGQEANQLVFSMKPEEKISILFWVKIPGFENKIEPQSLTFSYSGNAGLQLPDAYERVLHDCINGDHTLFPTTREIMHQWDFIESVLASWQNVPLTSYERGVNPQKITK